MIVSARLAFLDVDWLSKFWICLIFIISFSGRLTWSVIIAWVSLTLVYFTFSGITASGLIFTISFSSARWESSLAFCSHSCWLAAVSTGVIFLASLMQIDPMRFHLLQDINQCSFCFLVLGSDGESSLVDLLMNLNCVRHKSSCWSCFYLKKHYKTRRNKFYTYFMN